MAKFIIKKKGEDDVTIDAPSIEIGSRSTCALWIDDPVVAERHCRIIGGEDGKYYLSDMGTSTGTYMNAAAVKEAEIPAAAEIIIGVSRVQVAIDVATATLTITYDEKKTFYFDRRVDPLVWSRQELKFGRWRALKLVNVAALGSCLLIFLLSFVPPTSDKILDPGTLLHESIVKDRFHRSYADMLSTLDGSDQDCNACHADFRGTPIAKCIGCHEATMANNHPRIANAETWEVGCVYCHVEHRGTATAVLTNQRDPSKSCDKCHEAEKLPTADSKVSVTRKDTAYAYNTFAHADHADKNGLECMDCHGFSDAPWQDAAGRWHEFALLRYEDCMSCHAEGATHAKKSEKQYKVTWHGAEDDPARCTQCHAEANHAEIRQIDFTPVTRAFAYDSRSHQGDFDKFKGHPKDGCADCHKNGIELAGGVAIKDGVFEHGTHVKTLQPKDSAEKNKISAEECVTCHKERAESKDLAPMPSAHQHFTVGSCTECHDAKSGPGGTPFDVKETPMGAAMKRNDFPHDKHLKVDGGCYACHVFVGDQNATFKALPVTLDEAKSCVSCHGDHANIAGGACQECHKPAIDKTPADGVYWKDPAKWVQAKRPVGTGFSHNSPGHRFLVNPAKPDCGACHRSEDVWKAKSIFEVPIPDENDSLCTDCHIRRKQRFHFMLSDKK